MVDKRQLGAAGPLVHPLGIGAMSFSAFYGPTTDENSYAILDHAHARGVAHIDTANVYGMGRSETAIGTWIKARGAAVREDLVLATKGAITRDAAGARFFDNSQQHLEAELDASLQRLGVDCVDLYYVHRREADRPIEEVAGTLGRLVEKGKTKAIGFSEIAPASLRRAHAEYPVAAVQSEYSLSTRAPEMGLVQTCKDLGVALVAFSPVGRSLLTDSPLTPDVIATLDFLKNNPRFIAPNYATNIALTAPFRALAAEMGLAASSLAIAWVAARGAHVLPIPGTRSVAHLDELITGAERVLSAAEIAAVEAVLPLGWCHGDRYTEDQWVGPERYC
jgi:aryl-alcohol dehydrogenase-like predicted oxidoreductase